MVRIVAITASLEMSSQVGDCGAHQIGGKGKFEREQDPGGEAEPDFAAARRVGLALPNRDCDMGYRRHGAEGDDQHGARLNEQRDELGNLLEVGVERDG
jgi:hypothetical protein